jgi:hypothetical protein
MVTIKEQVEKTFVWTSGFTLIGLFLIITIVNEINGYIFKTDVDDVLFNQIEMNSLTVANESADIIYSVFHKAMHGFLLVYQSGYDHVLSQGSSYSLNPEPSFPDNTVDDLSPPLVTEPRFGDEVISLNHSSYFIPGFDADGSNIASMTDTNIDVIDSTSYLDRFFRSLYSEYDNFLAGYIGLDDSGLFRHYPGVSTLSTNPTRSYDPRIRGWYVDAEERPDDVIVTDPYLDFNGRGMMISFAKANHNDSGSFVGVTSSDYLLGDIQQSIEDANIIEDGKVFLVQTNGMVLVDSSNDLTIRDDIMMYSELEPEVSSEMWTTMLEQNGTITHGDILYTHMLVIDKYVLVMAVPTEIVRAPIQVIESQVDSTIMESFVVNLIVTIVFAVIVFFSSQIFISKTVTPISEVTKLSEKIARNIGSSDLFAGIDLTKQVQGVGEIQNMQQKYFEMATVVRDDRATAASAPPMMENPYFIPGTVYPAILPTSQPVYGQPIVPPVYGDPNIQR